MYNLPVELAQAVVDAGSVQLLVLCLQEPEISLKRIAASALSDIAKHTPEVRASYMYVHVLVVSWQPFTVDCWYVQSHLELISSSHLPYQLTSIRKCAYISDLCYITHVSTHFLLIHNSPPHQDTNSTYVHMYLSMSVHINGCTYMYVHVCIYVQYMHTTLFEKLI